MGVGCECEDALVYHQHGSHVLNLRISILTEKRWDIPNHIYMISTPVLSLKLIIDHQRIFILPTHSPREDQVPCRCRVLRNGFGRINRKRIEPDFEMLQVLF